MHVELLAQAGDTLKGQYEKLAGLTRRPDALIVYCGHNEMQSGIPWLRRVIHYFDERPSLLRRIDELAGSVSPICGLIRVTADRFRSEAIPPPGIHHPLVDSPGYTPAEYASRPSDFRHRLEAIASYCDSIGTLAILVVPPANDAGFDPNRSFLPARRRVPRRGVWPRIPGGERSREHEPGGGVRLYRSLLASQPGFAETHYRVGRLLENAGEWDEAYKHFIKARDLDGLPIRCMTSFQDIYLEVAARR